MSERRDNQTPYLQPAFLICTAVLAGAAVTMSLAAQRLGLYLQKEPLPLKKSLAEIAEEKLAPYRVVAKTAIEDGDILRSLGTRDYIQWVLEDPREPAASPVRRLLLFITYYAQADRVPHVPEECYTGGGYQRLATESVTFRMGSCEIPGRYLLFEKTTPDAALTLTQFPVLYLFRVNGEYAGSRDEARIALNKDIFSKHSYFCKIELACNQSSVAPTQEAAVKASEKILNVLLPVLEQDHWPDREMRKLGIRNSKSETSTNDRNPNVQNGLSPAPAFRSFVLWVLDLFRISRFEFRILGGLSAGSVTVSGG